MLPPQCHLRHRAMAGVWCHPKQKALNMLHLPRLLRREQVEAPAIQQPMRPVCGPYQAINSSRIYCLTTTTTFPTLGFTAVEIIRARSPGLQRVAWDFCWGSCCTAFALNSRCNDSRSAYVLQCACRQLISMVEVRIVFCAAPFALLHAVFQCGVGLRVTESDWWARCVLICGKFPQLREWWLPECLAWFCSFKRLQTPA